MNLYDEKQRQQKRRFEKIKELEKQQDDIDKKLENLKPSSQEFWNLQKQWVEISKKQMEIIKEAMDFNSDILSDNLKIEGEIKEMHNKLDEAGFFDRVNKTNDVFENPDSYTEEELNEAQEFENKLNEAFKNYTEENTGGHIQLSYEEG